MRELPFHNQGVAWAVVAGVSILVVVVAIGLRDPLPQRPDFMRHATRMSEVVPMETVEYLFSGENLSEMVIPTNSLSPFYTTFYQPPPVPEPPKAKRVVVVYQGFYESTDGRKLAFANVAGQPMTLPAGSRVVAGWFVNEIGLRTLTLTNAAGLSTVLQFRAKTQVKLN